MNTALLNRLIVAHRPKDSAGDGMPRTLETSLRERSLFIDTCLRQLAISTAIDTASLQQEPSIEIHSGHAAYSFLLQTASGLNSAVPGETNVAGQFRCAWKRWLNDATPASARTLAPLMHRLFHDTKQIRRDYLQHIGGASYGSLARKLLQPEADARILFAGAGKFALSMLPFFRDWQTALWNRRLHKGIDDEAAPLLFAPDEQAEAAAWATHLIITTPASDTADRAWLRLAAGSNIRQVMHLDRRRDKPGIWADLAVPFYDLDTVFDLRRRQSSLRDRNIRRARQACEQLAHEHAAAVMSAAIAVQEA